MRSTCCGVAHSAVKVSSGISPAAGRKLKMPPPPLFTRTTFTLSWAQLVTFELSPIASQGDTGNGLVVQAQGGSFLIT